MRLTPGLPSPERRDFYLFRLTFLGLLLFETASFLVFLTPRLGTPSFLVAAAALTLLTLWRFDWAITVLFIELCVGSQGGYLLSLPVAGLQFSLRMLLFTLVVGVWAARSVITLFTRRGSGMEWFRQLRESRLLWPLAVLYAVFALAFLNGWLQGHSVSDVFFDGNGYVYYAAVPALLAGLTDPTVRRRTVIALAAALSWSLTKALVVLFVFSHRLMVIAPDMYVWVRDTRVGEITRMVGDFYRIFFQSHVFALPLLFAAFTYLLAVADWRSRTSRAALAVFLVAATAVIMGFSRSFWFGIAVAGLALVAWAAWSGLFTGLWRRTAVLAAAALFTAVAVVGAVYAFPFPARTGDVSLAALLGGRALSLSEDAAATSRWSLLPKMMAAIGRHPFIGSGFGATVTYKTSDPRILALIPSGEYSTYAFEWGWHDLWLKLGLLGLAALLWFLWSAIRPAFEILVDARRQDAAVKEKAAMAAAILSGFSALLATNVFSPYLNHPLGIGIIVLLASFAGAIRNQRPSPSRDPMNSR